MADTLPCYAFRACLAGLLSRSSSFGGSLPNSLGGGTFLSTFSVKKGAVAPSKRLQLMWRSPLKHTLNLSLVRIWQISFGLRLLATVPEEPDPEELQIVASPGTQFILTGERKTAAINSAATI